VIGNVVAAIVVIVGFVVGIAIVGLSLGVDGLQGYLFALGVLVIAGSIGIPLGVLSRIE
jgi:hypothetical protein